GSLITNGSITNNGSISIQRSVTNAAWHLVSAPTSNATANSFVSGDYLQSWSESTGSWTDITVMSTALNPVQGYGLWNSSASARTYTFTGTPNTGNQSISITAAGTGGIYNGANLLGNPYPSSIDWDGLRTAYGAVYYWNGSAYVSWNNGGTGVRYIPPMQGFFVITASNTSFSLTNFNRTHAGATAYYKSTEDETMNNGLVLYADNGSYQDELYVSIENETQEGFELQNDAWKLPSNTAGLSQLWSVCTDGNLSIDRRPATDVIQLGFTNDVNGTYAIGLKEINGISKALIEDTKTGLRHDLMTGNYSFAWEANEDANRFKLLFNAVGIDEQASAGFSAYAIGKTIYISNPASEKLQIKLIDLMGRTVLNQQTGANSLISIPTALNSGVYIIQITDGKQSSSTKVIIR
ncbi:MAG: T9SS type A sorting domain-containing protein, partial [Bacteroidales bacterium]